jgi:hypothetical protein
MPLIYYITKRNPITSQLEVAIDANFNQNSLLLSSAIPNSTTTAISDGSTNNFSITAVGDVKPSGFNSYLPTWSNYFDGTGDYLTTPSSTAFTFGTGAFSIEAWVYQTARAASGLYTAWIYNNITTNIGNTQVGLSITVSGNLSLQTWNTVIVNSSVIPLHTWAHVAATFDGTMYRVFVNGVLSGTSTTVYNLSGTGNAYVGFVGQGSNAAFTGYISNVRVVKGSAVYTSNFTPSTSPLTAIANTSLLTCQSNRLIDNSLNNFTITKNGDVTVSPFTPFTTISIPTSYSTYFDGTGDYLTVPYNSVFNIPLNTAVTFECWVYTTSTNSFVIASRNWNWGGGGPTWGFYLNNGVTPTWSIAGTGSATFVLAVSSISGTLGQWNHYAFTRDSSNVVRIFVNGVQGVSRTDGQAMTSASGNVFVGMTSNGAALSTGYMSSLRFILGVAQYTSAFTPPTAPLTAIANTSLLTCQGSAPFNNSGFVNTVSGTSNLVVTRNGNATQGSYSPYTSNYSNYFDGTGDYLTVPYNSSLSLGTSDFTIELWVYPLTSNVSSGFIQTWSAGGQFIVRRNVASRPVFVTNAGATLTGTTTTIAANAWTHYAVVRNGTTITMYINGVADATTLTLANGYTFGSSVHPIRIGVDADLTGAFTGYISNVRVVKGSAVYTSNFTPSTSPLTAIANTSLLTCQSNRLIDNSPNNFLITKNGDVAVSPNSPFSLITPATPTSHAVSFSAKTQYLSIPATTSLTTFTGNFTFEAWIYPTNTSVTYWGFWDSRQSGATPQSMVFMIVPLASPVTGQGRLQYFNGTAYNGTGVVNYNTWTHVAWVRSSSTMTFYVNGVAGGTATVSGTQTGTATTNPIWIGIKDNGITEYGTTGLISNFRVVNGSAVYTSDFTPSTSPLTAIPNTSLLTCQDSTLKDNSTNNFTISSFGDARPSTTNPFGSTAGTATEYSTTLFKGSAYFDGTGDYLSVSSNPIFAFGTGNFTIECWVYQPVANGNNGIFHLSDTVGGLKGSSAGTLSVAFLGDKWNIYPGGASGASSSAGTLTANTWYHIALVRASGVVRLYVNGVSVISVNDTTNLIGTNLAIGGYFSTAYLARFYCSDFRVVTGSAVYTSNFLPPTAPISPVTNTTLLLDMSAGAIIDATGRNVIETFGNAKLSNSVVKYGNNSLYFDGTGDYLTVPSTPNLRFTGNFTIEAWIYPVARVSSFPCLVSNFNTFTTNGAVGIFAGHNNVASTKYTVAFNGTHPIIQSTSNILYNTWIHIALVRNGSTITLYINGVAEGSSANQTATVNGTQNFWWIGNTGDALATAAFNGYISDFRVSGLARYTANFTPPTTYLGIK